ncbi:sugar-phosphatase [Enterococcus cecorum]|nr:sugar-phosphatase [Enterococcus cecorum]
MAIKLIAIDIDGTLINDKHQITPEVHEPYKKRENKA